MSTTGMVDRVLIAVGVGVIIVCLNTIACYLGEIKEEMFLIRSGGK